MNVDFVATDWGTTGQRRALKTPPAQGGWNIFFSWHAGADCTNPALHRHPRQCDRAWFGWPDIPEVEKQVTAWFDAKNLEEEKAAIRALNKAAVENVVLRAPGLLPHLHRLAQQCDPASPRAAAPSSGRRQGLIGQERSIADPAGAVRCPRPHM